MSYQVLARKWRPRKFAELVGQEHVVRALSHALEGGRVHHAFLFTGTRGVGKTTIARIFAKSLNCERGESAEPCGVCAVCTEVDAGRFIDLLEIDAASNTGIDNVRDLIDNAQYAPSRGKYKVYLIDEVHMLSKAAFNALLKTLEEPPGHVKFLLATTDPQKLPVTVLSRCIKFNLKRLTPEQISGQIRFILGEEQIAGDDEAIESLARAADGSLRDGLSLLDQAIAHGGGSLRAADVHSMLGTVERGRVAVLLEALASGDGQGLIAEVQRISEFAPDYALVLDELSHLLHRLQLLQLVGANVGNDADVAALAQRVDARDVSLWYQMAVTGRRDLPMAPTPRVGFEMALLRMLAFAPQDASGKAPVAPARPLAAASASATPPSRSAPAASSAGISASRPAPSSTPPDGEAAAAAFAAILGKPAPAKPAAPLSPPAVVAAEPVAAVNVPIPAPAAIIPAPAPAPPSVLDQVAAAAEPEASESTPIASDLDDWPTLIDKANLRGPVGQIAQHAVLLGISGGQIRLAVKPAHQHLTSGPMVQVLEQRLGVALGRPVKASFEFASETGETPADLRVRAVSQCQQAAEDSIRTDPLVLSLQEEFGARIVPNSVQPNSP